MSGIRQIVPVPDGGRRFRAYTTKHLDALTARAGLGEAERLAVRAVGTVLPFRTNAYVIDELIDWGAAPDDPPRSWPAAHPSRKSRPRLMRYGCG